MLDDDHVGLEDIFIRFYFYKKDFFLWEGTAIVGYATIVIHIPIVVYAKIDYRSISSISYYQ
jgi:hypothetical protein